MLLYHGTSESIAERICDEGILPRGGRPSKWKAGSDPASVYMTASYAMHFAANAFNGHERLAIVEIDTARLETSRLAADEDALALAWGLGCVDAGTDNGRIAAMTVELRARHFAAQLQEWAASGADWKWSLDVIGNCTFRGPVPPEAVSRIVTLDGKGSWWLEWHDPVVSPQNFRHMGDFYTATNFVFADRLDRALSVPMRTGSSCDLREMDERISARRSVLMER